MEVLMHISDSVEDAIDALARHSFIARLEWLYDIPPRTISYSFPPESGQVPSVKYQLNVPIETISTCDEVSTVYHHVHNILRTTRTLWRIRGTISSIDFSKETGQAAEEFAFQIENYYLRLPTVLEQVYSVVAVLCDIPFGRGAQLRQFEEALRHQEKLWELVKTFKRSIQPIKNTRNLIAHMGEFTDDEYDVIAHFLSAPSSAWAMFRVPDWLGSYRYAFLTQAELHLRETVIFLNNIFNVLLQICRARYKEDVAADHSILLRKA
jgi:hypothetical protein